MDFSLFEFKKLVDFSKIFEGRIESVDLEKMSVDIVMREGAIVARNVGINCGYFSEANGSMMLFVPRVGDRVLVGQKNDDSWEIVGYSIGMFPDGKSAWQAILSDEQVNKPYVPAEGDFVLAVRGDGGRCADVLVLSNGIVWLSAGFVNLVLDQMMNSLKGLAGYFRWDSDSIVMELGGARFVENGLEVSVPLQSLWKVSSLLDSAEMSLGYVNNKGIPELVEGGQVVARVKVGQSSINLTKDGVVFVEGEKLKIKVGKSVLVMTNDGCEITTDKVTVKKDMLVEGEEKVLGGLEVEKKLKVKGTIEAEGDGFTVNEKKISVKGDEVSLSSQRVKIDGQKIDVKGDETLTGSYTLKGRAKIEGGLEVMGSEKVSGDVSGFSFVGRKFKGDEGEFGGSLSLILETILDALSSHVHFIEGKPTTVSPMLHDLSAHKTKKLKGV